ncbi:hypothetical protein ACFLT2_03385 [Acidobacteriota bacterium]
MLEPLKQWICDACGEIIKSPSEGWVEWLSDGEDLNFNSCHRFRIVHDCNSSPRGYRGCYTLPDTNICDNHLEYFLGEGGYLNLLNFLDPGPYFMKDEDYKGPSVRNMREFVEFMIRLTIPYYEEARLYFDEAIANEDLALGDDISAYHPENLKRLIEIYGKY